MADWSAASAAPDNFLRDTLTLSGAGATSHEEVLDWAESQYTAFAESRRRRQRCRLQPCTEQPSVIVRCQSPGVRFPRAPCDEDRPALARSKEHSCVRGVRRRWARRGRRELRRQGPRRATAQVWEGAAGLRARTGTRRRRAWTEAGRATAHVNKFETGFARNY